MNFESIIGFMNTPFIHLGDTPVTLGGIGGAILLFFGMLMLSSIVQKVIAVRLQDNKKISSGLLFAMQRILHYLFILVGIFMATQCIGINLGSLAVVFGFLGVGIGLGLQNVTSNFVAGLILLIERPVSVGDFVNVEGQIGRVLRIDMRSTLIMTIDNITIIVPNAKLIDEKVINWSIIDSRVRLHCPVGVAYGSDLEKVKAALLDVAKEHPQVLDHPEPEIRFLEFGDSSLNFDLLVWTSHPQQQFRVISEINFMIDAAFRKYGITIPFPQRDVHLKTEDQGIKGLKG